MLVFLFFNKKLIIKCIYFLFSLFLFIISLLTPVYAINNKIIIVVISLCHTKCMRIGCKNINNLNRFVGLKQQLTYLLNRSPVHWKSTNWTGSPSTARPINPFLLTEQRDLGEDQSNGGRRSRNRGPDLRNSSTLLSVCFRAAGESRWKELLNQHTPALNQAPRSTKPTLLSSTSLNNLLPLLPHSILVTPFCLPSNISNAIAFSSLKMTKLWRRTNLVYRLFFCSNSFSKP